MYDGVERLGGHVLVEQVDQTVAGVELAAVQQNGEAGVQEDIVFEQGLNELLAIGIVLENRSVGGKLHQRAVGLVGGGEAALGDDLAAGIAHRVAHAVAIGLYEEARRQGIHRLDTHAVQTHRFLEGLGVVLATGVHLRRHVSHLVERNTPPVVSHRDHLARNLDNNLFAKAHHVLVERIVENLLQQHVDTVVGVRTVAQLSNVHTGPAADMLLPVESLDGVGAIFKVCIFLCIFCHKFPFRRFYLYRLSLQR